MKQIKTILLIFLTIAILATFKLTAAVSIRFILSIFIVFLVLPFTNTLEKHKFPSAVASFLAILLIIVVVFALSWFIFYIVDLLIKILPGYASKLQQIDGLLSDLVSRWVDIPDNFSIFQLVDIDWIGSVIMPALRTVSSQTINIVSNTSVTILLSAFLLLERHTVLPKLIMLSNNSESQETISNILDRMNHQLATYLTLKVCISFVTGVLFFLLCRILNMDLAVICGVLAFVLNFIPTFGSIIVTIITILMAAVQFLPNWTNVIIITAGTIAIEQVLGNIIEPKLQGSQLNLSSFVILVALSLFGYIWGIAGMFLAVPLLSVLEIIFANIESTKGIAIMLSSGRSLRRRLRTEKKRDKQPGLFDEVFLP